MFYIDWHREYDLDIFVSEILHLCTLPWYIEMRGSDWAQISLVDSSVGQLRFLKVPLKAGLKSGLDKK